MKTETQEKRIYRYLLGDLPEEDQFALEQEFLADGALFEQVWAAENELIDRYVRGGLTSAEKHLFEKNYLACSSGRLSHTGRKGRLWNRPCCRPVELAFSRLEIKPI